MRIFYRRPLATVCFVFTMLSIWGSRAGGTAKIVLFCLLVAAVILAFLWMRRVKTAARILTFACFLAGVVALLVSFLFFQIRYESYKKYVDAPCAVEGIVLERRGGGSYATSFTVALSSIDGESCAGDAILECEYASALQPGDAFRADVIPRSPETTDEETDNLSDGIFLIAVCASSEDCTRLDETPFSIRVLFRGWNRAIAHRLETAVGGEAGRLCSALLLGNRRDLSGDTTLHFTRAGVRHLLALSGLHVAILIGFVGWILLKLRMSKTLRILVVTLLSVGYLILTGCSYSAARAVLTVAVLNLGFLCKGEYDAVTALFAVLAGMLIATPYAVTDVGFWMSFLATGSIVIFLPLWNRWIGTLYEKRLLSKGLIRRIARIGGALFVGLCANLAILLLEAVVFGEASLASIPTTLILSLPTAATILLSIASLICPPLAPLCRVCANLILKVTGAVSSLRGVVIPLDFLPCKILLIGMTVVLICLAVLKWERTLWLLLPPALAAATVLASYAVLFSRSFSVTVYCDPASTGETVLFTSGISAVAVDFSDGGSLGARTLARDAKDAGCTEIGDLILTHYHDRAAYFLSSICRQIRVRTLRLPKPCDAADRAIARRLREEAELHGTEVRFDADDLCLSDLCVTDWIYAPSDEGHPAVLFSAEVGERTVTYVNAAVPESIFFAHAVSRMEASDLLLFGADGYSDGGAAFPQRETSPDFALYFDPRIEPILPYFSASTKIALVRDGTAITLQP